MKIIGVRSYNFTAILIHIGMIVWQLKHLRWPKLYHNHWVIEINGVYYEAIGSWTVEGLKYKDVVRWDKEKSQSYHRKSVKNRDVIAEYNLHEVLQYNVVKWLDAQVGKGYEYSNFLWHTIKIIQGHWFGKRSFEKHSCVELITGALRILPEHGFIDVYMNPVELEDYLTKEQ